MSLVLLSAESLGDRAEEKAKIPVLVFNKNGEKELKGFLFSLLEMQYCSWCVGYHDLLLRTWL